MNNFFSKPIKCTEAEANEYFRTHKYKKEINNLDSDGKIKSYLAYLPETMRSIAFIENTIGYDIREYNICPCCKLVSARSILCRGCLLYALDEAKKKEVV